MEIQKELLKSKIHNELRERYSNEGYYALAILVLIIGLGLYVSYEASVVMGEWEALEALNLN